MREGTPKRTIPVLLAGVVAITGLVMPTILAAAPTKAVHPPKTGRIVEGLSAGGVSIGDSYADMIAAWGKPDDIYCDHRNDGEGLGSVYRNGVSECAWYVAPHNSLGTLEASLAPLTTYGATTDAKVVLIRIWDLKNQPGYKSKPELTGWRTASGIGLRSTLAATQKAYGRRLHTVPYGKRLTPGQSGLTYLATRRGGRRWVTIFSFSRARDAAPLTVNAIWIEEYSLLAPIIKQAEQIYGPADVPLK
jgi:hypothetical protein